MYHQNANPFGLRIALSKDSDRCRKIMEMSALWGKNSIALYLATALNELDEHKAMVSNQRKRLRELEMPIGSKKAVSKYYASEDTSDVLANLRNKYAPPAPTDGKG